MANIKISNLKPAGSALFSDSESFMGSMRDVSEDELKITGGGGKRAKKYDDDCDDDKSSSSSSSCSSSSS
ncbi:MAG: hypothetical protein QNJ46_07860 [Leptolyngbyaceae cyanobacterium MO_188.B28]|nr:hypothetical protein [Leptolyngbyaceae cyanobacterium MO_188.B28]